MKTPQKQRLEVIGAYQYVVTFLFMGKCDWQGWGSRHGGPETRELGKGHWRPYVWPITIVGSRHQERARGDHRAAQQGGREQIVLTDCMTDRSPVFFPFDPGLSSTLLVFFLLFILLWSFSVPYFVWLYLDWNTPIQGRRHSRWMRKWTIWKHQRDYFPIKVTSPNSRKAVGLFPL